jgi:methylated-DNA-[protein]-cysteine S-methyltransferase
MSGARMWTRYQSPFGTLTLTATDDGLDGLLFSASTPDLERSDRRSDLLADAAEQLDEYFAGSRRAFDLPLDLHVGTPFQGSVWTALWAIPHGETITYAQLAARLDRPAAIRAVGGAVGRNPLPIVIPCHRVIGSDGSLTGYLGGLGCKRALLELEAALPAARPGS